MFHQIEEYSTLAGYALDHTASGLDADHALETIAFDLLILDLGLPRLSGIEV